MKLKPKHLLYGVGSLVLAAIVGATVFIGPRNITGLLRYDTRREGALKVGEPAPDVALLALDGSGATSLRARLMGKPLFIIFGSFTGPPFRRSVERLKAMHARYGAQADFLTIY